VDRAVVVALAIVAAVMIGLGTVWALRDYANPAFANGVTAAHQLDVTVGDMLAARFPEVRVGAATCPALLDLTGHRIGRCTFPVAGTTMQVDVSTPNGARNYRFRTVEALFVRSDAERRLAEMLAQRHGETFDVTCPGPAVRVLAHGAPVTCTVQAPDVTRRSIEVRPFGDDGSMMPGELAGIATRRARVFGADVAARREGSVVIAGRAIEQFLRGSAGAQAQGEVGRRGLVRGARCPANIVLHEGTHAGCTVRIANVTQQYDVHFEKGLGLRIDTEKTVAVVPALRDVATRYFQRPTYTGGKPANVHVDCGRDLVVFVEPGSALPCLANVGAKEIGFRVDILDPGGSFVIVANAEDRSGTAP
jgi:hypothetical protein